MCVSVVLSNDRKLCVRMCTYTRIQLAAFSTAHLHKPSCRVEDVAFAAGSEVVVVVAEVVAEEVAEVVEVEGVEVEVEGVDEGAVKCHQRRNLTQG